MPQDESISRQAKPIIQIGFLAKGSIEYCDKHGLQALDVDFRNVVACEDRGQRIAAAYIEAPVIDNGARASYRAFLDETARQFHYLTDPHRRGGLAVNIEVCPDDPYPDAAAMTWDLAQNNRLKIYATGGPGNEHPLLTNDENDMFRAVHDAFGHAAVGLGFDPDGEEAAWLKHSSMYSLLARAAMTTETRGQNCAMVFAYGGRQFPEQKAFLLTDEFTDPANVCLRSIHALGLHVGKQRRQR